MIPYLLHASILIAGSYLIYILLIKKETFFKLNRWILISTLALSVTVPLVTVPSYISLLPEPVKVQSQDATLIEVGRVADTSPEGIGDQAAISDQAANNAIVPPMQTSTSATSISPSLFQSLIQSNKIWWVVYLAGVAIFIITFLVQLFIIIAKTNILQSFKDGKYRIVELTKDQAPFSFWNSIFINPSKYDEETFQQILAHEKIHIDQSHFLDKLVGEFLVIVFWFNPFAWLSRSAISNNLEYLTDQSMLHKGAPKEEYQMSLLKVSVPQHPLYLTTNFNQSFLKNRIAMMNAKKSSARSTWKYLFLLPFFGLSMLTLNAVEASTKKLASNDTPPLENKAAAISSTEKETETPTSSNNTVDENTALVDCCDDITQNMAMNEDCCANKMNELTKADEALIELRDILIDKLYDDGFTQSKDQVVFFEYLESGIRLHGKLMNQDHYENYKTLLEKYGLDPTEDRVFGTKPVIVLSGKFTDAATKADYDTSPKGSKITSSSRAEDASSKELLKILQKQLFSDGIISTREEPVIIKVLEDNITINDEELSRSLDKKYRAILSKHHIDHDTDGIRIVVPITIVSGSMAQNYQHYGHNSNQSHTSGNHQYHYSTTSGQNQNSSAHEYHFDTNDDDFNLDHSGHLDDEYHSNTSELGTYKKMMTNKKTLITKAHKAYSKDNWQLIAFKDALFQTLKQEGLIDQDNNQYVNLSVLNNYVSVNGNKIRGNDLNNLENVFNKYNMPFEEGFRIIQHNNHIGVLDPLPSLDDLKEDMIDHLYSEGLIDKKSQSILLEISGHQVRLNKSKLSESAVDRLYKLLHSHNVTPSPGKLIQINKKENIVVHVGYQFDDNYVGIMELK